MKKLIYLCLAMITVISCSRDNSELAKEQNRELNSSKEDIYLFDESEISNYEKQANSLAPSTSQCIYQVDFDGYLVNSPGTNFDYDMKFVWDAYTPAVACNGPYIGTIEMRTDYDFFCPPNPAQSNKQSTYNYTIPGNIHGTIDSVVIPHTDYLMKIFEYRLVIVNSNCPQVTSGNCYYATEWKCINIFD